MATKVSAVMVTLRMLLVVICVYRAGLTESAPTELGHGIGAGAYPKATKEMTSPIDDAKQWLPQKPARSKHTTAKLSLQKKPIKDKASWTKMQTAGGGKGPKVLYSPTLVSTGYDVEKDILSRIDHLQDNVAGGDILVDNVAGPKGYPNNSTTPLPIRQIHPAADDDDDDDDSGKDIDFISIARATKADETYATEPPPPPASPSPSTAAPATEGHHAKGEGLDAQAPANATTLGAGLVENPNFNADPMARMSTKTTTSHTDDNAAVIQDIKSIAPTPSPTFTPPPAPTHTMTAPSAFAKSLPVNASLSPSLSLSSSQPSATTASAAKMTSTTTTTVATAIAAPTKLDVGHDGVKITKKKQLFDKHFIAPSTPSHSPSAASGSLQPPPPPPPPLADGNPRPLSKNKPAPAKGGKKLIEVPNGYLGPIMMKEKTFSVSHHASKKPKPSIVEQLRDKKLVEIIAPTALMEPTTKVKSSSPPPPEFVAIESAPSSSSTTTTTTTSTSTQSPIDVSTSATTKEEEVESETATTYFLVVTQNSEEAGDKRATAEREGLKEIYTEALNAMEEASKRNKPTTEIAIAHLSTSTEQPSISTQTEQTSVDVQPSVVPVHGHLQQSTEGDHTVSTSESPSHRSTLVVDHLRAADAKQLQILRTTPGIAVDHHTSTTDRDVQTTEVYLTEMGSPTEAKPTQMITEGPLFQEHRAEVDQKGPEYDRKVLGIHQKIPKITDHLTTDGPSATTSTIGDQTATVAPTPQPLQASTPARSTTEDKSTSTADLKLSITTEGVVHDSTPTTNEPITTTASPMVQHDSSAGTTSTILPPVSSSTIAPTTTDHDPTFATITSDIFPSTSTPQQQLPLKPTHDSEQTESKISDIQIEVYDSTVESILASTNFKENSEAFYPSTHVTTKQSPSNLNSAHQERFTQYVVDKANDFATQESSSVAKAPGKPEPAAIEIHINVSEGFGNESEDLEFSYRQSDYRKASASKKAASSNFITLKPFDAVPQNETSNEAAEEIVVEIIDANTNSTENSASRENLNVNPIFTFRSDDDSQVELKNVKYYPEDRPKELAKPTDDFFVPDVAAEPPGVSKPIMDRDSDTIFYISNTEVKVGESLPTTNTYDAQLKRTRLENQFFPADYEERKKAAPQRYEEDIILSPLKNRNSDPLKLVRGPLDISYVGESVMEVEQAPVTTTVPPPVPGSTPDVIIQPAILPEMAIGVPVIGELPPQIELKEIDFMPNFDANKEDSSIQYGGDLIDEGGAMGAGFDMDSYPLGNLGLGQRHDAISSQAVFNHHVNHFKKDELSADLAASSETADANDLLRRSNESANGTVIGERMGNATAYSVMEEPPAADGEIRFTDLHTLFTACLATLLPLVLSVVMAFGLRHLYRKYQTNSFSVMGHNSSTDPLDAEKAHSGDGSGDGDADDGAQTPDELRASPLEFGATANSLIIDLCPSEEVHGSMADAGDGRRDRHGSGGGGNASCGGGGAVANGRVPSDMDDVHCIQTIIPDGVQEENATAFIVNCIPEAQPTAPPTTAITATSTSTTTTSPPQSAAIAIARAGGASASASASAAAVANPTSATAGTMQCNYSGANGSITTMTLKNNHLIVETEERNDISRNARETKMHYNNSEKDGVFVVEVSRGADSKIMPGSPVGDPGDKCPFSLDPTIRINLTDNEKPALSSSEEVQVHPPPPESACVPVDIDSNHLHQIDEVDELEEGPKITKNSNTGLSQSDLSSSSSVDSNKRYSYGNQELYTIEQQDYNTPSPAATRAPHPHADPQPPQPENHNDDNGHSENGHCLENDPPSAPNSDPIYPADADSDVNGHSGVESKPKITAALLKQDTVIANNMTNGVGHNGHTAEDEPSPHNSMENLHNGTAPTIKADSSIVDYGGDTENGFDSIISLPDPPSTEEMKQMNDIILMETNQLDSLPPPPPPAAENHSHHNGSTNGHAGTENGDSHSIGSSTSPTPTPTKVMTAPAPPPTITVASAAASAPADIPHTNGNCMTGHTTAASTAAVVEVSGSS